MPKFLNILKNILSEQKRYQFSPDVYEKLNKVVDKLWNDRNIEYKKKTTVDAFQFKLADGTDGIVRVVVNPRLPYIGLMGTNPKKSLDPADIFVEVNPKKYESKKNLYLTLYHELIHASDPTQSHLWKPSYEMTYSTKKDEMYWGHPIEFFAITNEFLEGLTLEFRRRKSRLKNLENIKVLEKSLKNILNYFSKNEKLTRQSLDILYRINDEYVNQNKISQILSNIETDFPRVSELLPTTKDDVPYYLHYIELIKKFNPKIWPKFLTMLFKTAQEIKENLK